MSNGQATQLRVTGPGRDERIFMIPTGTAVIGRLESTALQLDHPQVLRHHARLVTDERGSQIIELRGATVRVNGRDIPSEIPHPLSPGDIIEIGPFRLVYETMAEETAPAEEEEILSEDDLVPAEAPAEEEEAAAPPPPSSLLPPAVMAGPPPPPDYSDQPIPGLGRHSVRFINYLPRIYQNDFMRRFLAIFEAVWLPIQWNVDNFDLYLDPRTAPDEFLEWMGSWFGVDFDDAWNEEMRRVFLREAHEIYARRGTRWALTRLLEIYTGRTPEIIDDDSQDPFTFTVKFSQRERDLSALMAGIERIIDANKPVHTSYRFEFGKRADIDDILGRFSE